MMQVRKEISPIVMTVISSLVPILSNTEVSFNLITEMNMSLIARQYDISQSMSGDLLWRNLQRGAFCRV
jgi:hypothetical protein